MVLDFGVMGILPCDIEFDYTPGQRGRFSGPPEDCYPDEPEEISVTKVTYGPYDFTKLIDEDLVGDMLVELARDAAQEALDDARAAYYESRREEEYA